MSDPSGQRAISVGDTRLPTREFLHLMLISHECDRREAILMRQGKGWISEPGMGHEATAVLGYHLQPEDYLFAYCRDRPLYLACGVTLEQMAGDFFANSCHLRAGDGLIVRCMISLAAATEPIHFVA